MLHLVTLLGKLFIVTYVIGQQDVYIWEAIINVANDY
jgi:hypothetical protein